MIDLKAAEELLDFSSRIGKGQRAQEQLIGSVALHNMLEKNNVAYLADEVGMGKTYVALGAIALFRHFQPSFRIIIIAPRENIQMKWIKEFRNFVANNVRFHDLRVKGVDGKPARKLIACGNLLDLVRETTLDPDRDFFLRLTSFSLPLAGREDVDPDCARRLRDGLRKYVPWLSDEIFDLRRKKDFKDNYARALNCALPDFDLVIVDEGHNLKHGLSEHVASRNRVLAFAFGHPEANAGELFLSYGPRAKRVLFLSATPVEETYRHLWNQLHVFGLGGPFEELKNDDVDEDEKKKTARRFLIRRVTSINVNGDELTKNLYRREWREGGVIKHDDPIIMDDNRSRLIVALVQKKVAEILGREDFKPSFQIGMLASFESFLETAKLTRADEEPSVFDDSEQADDQIEREGIDVADINRISRDYRKRFNSEMPHPKMDEVVESLSSCWEKGEKTLVFVRRVASVKELKRKLDERYNEWLFSRLRRELPPAVQPRLEETIKRYIDERNAYYAKLALINQDKEFQLRDAEDLNDEGGTDTFFAWFFRGEGPKGIVSGANVQKRFIQRGTVYSTFFEDNHVAAILDEEPGGVKTALARYIGISEKVLDVELKERSRRFVGKAKKVARGERYEAAQAAAIEWLKDTPGQFKDRAQFVWHELYEQSRQSQPAQEAPEIGDILETRTFFTELRKKPKLRELLWPEPKLRTGNDSGNFRENVLRAQLLATAARLGHSFIDLYLMTIRRLGSLELRAQEDEEERGSAQIDGIHEYLSLLEDQMEKAPSDRQWCAFDELSLISRNFDLILDVNAPDVKIQPQAENSLADSSKMFGRLLRRQQPVGGMFGQVNQTLVRQFRMPGYPLVLITTDLLQEGEDLHTFCSSVHHYGISWTPSSMEQRIGRIDRVRSESDRRLSTLKRPIQGSDMLQVYYPYLRETVELFQVKRVLKRMNEFLRLMHEGLVFSTRDDKEIDVDQEFIKTSDDIPRIKNKLKSAFEVRDEFLHGEKTELKVGHKEAEAVEARFDNLKSGIVAIIDVAWEDYPIPGKIYGTVKFGERQHPFRLELGSVDARPLVRCVSPIGRVEINGELKRVQKYVQDNPLRICAFIKDDSEYLCELTVEGDVVLGERVSDDANRVGEMVRRITYEADRIENVLRGNDEMPMSEFRDGFDQELVGDD